MIGVPKIYGMRQKMLVSLLIFIIFPNCINFRFLFVFGILSGTGSLRNCKNVKRWFFKIVFFEKILKFFFFLYFCNNFRFVWFRPKTKMLLHFDRDKSTRNSRTEDMKYLKFLKLFLVKLCQSFLFGFFVKIFCHNFCQNVLSKYTIQIFPNFF